MLYRWVSSTPASSRTSRTAACSRRLRKPLRGLPRRHGTLEIGRRAEDLDDGHAAAESVATALLARARRRFGDEQLVRPRLRPTTAKAPHQPLCDHSLHGCGDLV